MCILSTVPPVITQDTDTFYSNVEGEELALHCEVEGDPPPAIVWLQDGVALQDLHLPDVTIQDLGTSTTDNVTKSKVCFNIFLLF